MSKIRKLAACLAASASLFGAQLAGAATYTPAGTWTFEDVVQVQKGSGPILNCTVSMTFDVPEAAPDTHGTLSHGHFLNGPTTISIGQPEPLCQTIFIQSSNPHTVTKTGEGDGEAFTINGVYVNTTITLGDCAGNIPMVLRSGTVPYFEVNASLPAVISGTGDCTILGNVKLKTPFGGTVTP